MLSVLNRFSSVEKFLQKAKVSRFGRGKWYWKLSFPRSYIHYFICWVILIFAVSHPEEILGQRLQMGIWSTFVNTSETLLIYIALHTFCPFFSAVSDVLLNRTQGNSLFTWEIYQITTFFSHLHFLGHFFEAPITFEHYYF